MNKSVLLTGKWLSILLAVISSFWLLFGQLYVLQFILLAYVLSRLANQSNYQRPKNISSGVVVALIVLSCVVTIYAGVMVEHGFRGTDHYSTPSMLTIILSSVDVVLMALTLGLYAKFLKQTR